MATKSKQAPEKSGQHPGTVPAGMVKLTPEFGGAWWSPEGSTNIMGALIGRHTRPGLDNKIQTYYQIELHEGASWLRQGGERVEAGQGEIINLGYRSGLSPLDNVPTGTEVCVVVNGKGVSKKTRKPYWDLEVHAALPAAPAAG